MEEVPGGVCDGGCWSRFLEVCVTEVDADVCDGGQWRRFLEVCVTKEGTGGVCDHLPFTQSRCR